MLESFALVRCWRHRAIGERAGRLLNCFQLSTGISAILLAACSAAGQEPASAILLDGVVPLKLEKRYQLPPFSYGGSMHEVVFSLDYRSGQPTTSSPVDTESAIVVDLVRYLPKYLDIVFAQKLHMFSRYFEASETRHNLEFRRADPNDANGGKLYVRRTGGHYDLIIECQFAGVSPTSLCEMTYQLPNDVRVHTRFSHRVVADWAAIETVTRKFVTERLK